MTAADAAFVADVRNGRLDVAFLGVAESAVPRGVATRELARETLVAVVPRSSRLAGRGAARLADIAAEVFVDFPSGTAGRAQSDLATALLSKNVVQDDGALTTVALDDGPRRVEYVAWSDFNPSSATQAFMKVVECYGKGRDYPSVGLLNMN